MKVVAYIRKSMLCAAISASVGYVELVQAEEEDTGDFAALEEIIVTAQKRDEGVQEVPISMTALTQEDIQTSRVTNVTDLSGLAPNLAARPAPGGTAIASFSMRGITSFGVVPGSDKEISIYLDGVYLGSPRGSIFNLPDIAQLEVLRGPQGTLFGRNATAGAINVTTRDPSGELGLRQEMSFGDHNYERRRTSIDSPTLGPFSFLLTYASEERDGDIKNRFPDDIYWDRTAFGEGTAHTISRFGDKDAETYFFAASFVPNDVLMMTYKVDKAVDHGTPAANVSIALDRSDSRLSQLLAVVDDPSAIQLASNFKRPDYASDSFAITGSQDNVGHSLTTLIEASDNISFKNITAYRKATITSASDLLGLGGLTILGGQPFCLVCSQNSGDFDQWSTELQFNYESDLVTLTVGTLYFKSDERSGFKNAFNTVSGKTFPDYVIPAGDASTSYNDAKSVAAYTQAEFHLSDEIDLVSGYRWSRDTKNGDFVTGTEPAEVHSKFHYQDSSPSWALGVNYKPEFGRLIYGKYSEAFVSGGAIGGLEFKPEVAKSWEAGFKADFLDNTLRSNVSVFSVTYDHVQSAQSGQNIGRPELGTAIVDQGGETKAQGFEWEGAALAGDDVTLNASAGYTHVEIMDPAQPLLDSVQASKYPGSSYEPSLIPDWTGSLAATYRGDPVFDSARIVFNINGQWHSKIRMEQNPVRADANPNFIEFSPAGWVINARLALQDIKLGIADGTAEVGLWGRNLTDNDDPQFALNFGGIGQSASYLEARSYGVDLAVDF